MRLSFVIIGKNEEFNIIRTVQSIKNLNLPYEYEIIYIDSNSHDETIEKIRQIEDVQIYKIESNFYSAALARNIGASKSKGLYLFFLDGDIEIMNASNIEYVLNAFKDKDIGVISGKLPEITYDHNHKIIKTIDDRYNVKFDLEKLNEPGGYFIISRKLFKKTGGFTENIKCNEELEFFCRVLKQGKKLKRSQKLICTHHNLKTSNTSSFNEYYKFKDKYYLGVWRALIKSICDGNFKYYNSFKTIKRSWLRRIVIISVFILTVVFIFTNMKIFALILVLANLVYAKFDIKKVVNVYITNIFIFLSVIFLHKRDNIKYMITKISSAKGEKHEDKNRAYQ